MANQVRWAWKVAHCVLAALEKEHEGSLANLKTLHPPTKQPEEEIFDPHSEVKQSSNTYETVPLAG
ncbi:hypothetical protein B0H16DRAFT_1713071 [Mycena metata]|uniref:Uncharacterized protein n=1 Tax=Mycena metata TaxID=1033252 RepID=A0AAD7K020_9AGAR|nr:hypothetical protein B0H16DRAFT_1713071 [Mycena metata]